MTKEQLHQSRSHHDEDLNGNALALFLCNWSAKKNFLSTCTEGQMQ